jgi:glyoxylase-like metal-dependent hydrolase (beta-lactamase superfamily II)
LGCLQHFCRIGEGKIFIIDYLLLTHGHLDHSWDFPNLASKHHPQAYGPAKYLENIQKKEQRWQLNFNRSRLHALEGQKGRTFHIKDLEVI